MVGLAGLSVPLAGVGAFGPVGEATDWVVGDVVAGMFLAVAVAKVVSAAGAAVGSETLDIDVLFAVALRLFAIASEKKKQLPTIKMKAATLRQVDVDLRICMMIIPCLKISASSWSSKAG
jgi:hypothetical protein